MPKPAGPVDSAAAAAAAAPAAETVPKSTSSSKSEPSSSSPNPIPRLARAAAVASRSASPPRGASSALIPSARSRSPNKLEDKSLARAPGDRLLCRRPSPASAACNAAFPSGSAATSPSATSPREVAFRKAFSRRSADADDHDDVDAPVSDARVGERGGVDAERTSTPTGTEGREGTVAGLRLLIASGASIAASVRSCARSDASAAGSLAASAAAVSTSSANVSAAACAPVSPCVSASRSRVRAHRDDSDGSRAQHPSGIRRSIAARSVTGARDATDDTPSLASVSSRRRPAAASLTSSDGSSKKSISAVAEDSAVASSETSTRSVQSAEDAKSDADARSTPPAKGFPSSASASASFGRVRFISRSIPCLAFHRAISSAARAGAGSVLAKRRSVSTREIFADDDKLGSPRERSAAAASRSAAASPSLASLANVAADSKTASTASEASPSRSVAIAAAGPTSIGFLADETPAATSSFEAAFDAADHANSVDGCAAMTSRRAVAAAAAAAHSLTDASARAASLAATRARSSASWHANNAPAASPSPATRRYAGTAAVIDAASTDFPSASSRRKAHDPSP